VTTVSESGWRAAVSFLLPDEVDPQPLSVAGREFVDRDDVAAVVRIGRRKLHLSGFPNRYGFLAFPPHTAKVRFLLPHHNQAAIRHMVRPRAEREPGVLRGVHRVVESMPPKLVEATSLSVEVATRSVSPTVARLHQIAPRADIGCLFTRTSAGRSAVCAFDGERLCAIAKVVTTASGSAQLDHEAAMLRELSAHDRLRGYVPQLEKRLSVRSGEVLVTDAFHGSPAPTSISPALKEWLRRCPHGDIRSVSDAAVIIRTVERANQHGDAQLAQRALDLLQGARSRPCVVHGDFAPWNVVVRGEDAFVFDWEYGVADGVPEWDALFFLVQVGIIVSRWNGLQLAAAIRTNAEVPSTNYTERQYLGMAALLLLDLRGRYRERCDHVREHVVATAVAEIARGAPRSR